MCSFDLFFFVDQNNKRIVLALQSGLKNELTWALNTLTLLSFKEKDDMRKDATPLAKIPGLLDALLQVVCATNLVLHFYKNVQRRFVVQIVTLFNIILSCNLKQIDDWRDIALPKELAKTTRVRTLGASSVVTGFGCEYQALGSTGTHHRPG